MNDKHRQELKDRLVAILKSASIDQNTTLDELADYLIENGVVDKKELNRHKHNAKINGAILNEII